MEKLEAGLKLISNLLKCSSFQRPGRVLAMREFRPIELGKKKDKKGYKATSKRTYAGLKSCIKYLIPDSLCLVAS